MSPGDPNQLPNESTVLERPPTRPSRPEPEPSQDEIEDHQFEVAEKLVGTAMMFVGFLSVLISISSGAEMAGVFQVVLYFGGLAIWAHASVRNATLRYAVMTVAIACGLAFIHYGEILFWHKQVIFWGTVVLVVFFMFVSTKSPK